MDRRDFFRATTLAAALPLGGPARAAATPAPTPGGAALAWLEGAPAFSAGTTFGVPWPRGAVPKGQDFVVDGGAGEMPAQSWPLAYWPDGSLKWTAHALGAGGRPLPACACARARRAPVRATPSPCGARPTGSRQVRA